MSAIRYATHFEALDGSITALFPKTQYEYLSQSPLKVADTGVIGEFGHDFVPGVTERNIGVINVNFMLTGIDGADVDAQLQELTSRLYRIGRGYLITKGPDGSLRRAECRLTNLPDALSRWDALRWCPVGLVFRRYTSWQSLEAVTGVVDVAATPVTFTITNPGNATVHNAVFRLRADSATGYTNPKLENLTTVTEVASSRDAASADSELKIDCGLKTVERSTDNGANYTDDYSNVTLPATQAGFITLAPGVNNMRYTDGATPDMQLEYSFYPEWHS